ncbi:MAG: MFS transporter [Acidimicrobiia bacterium]|nr:MFS transporter [Acidimicrobiia bacterium]
MPSETPLPRARIAVLGFITISVYGSWYYGFGVLLDPIIADTGWSEATLTAVFGASSLVAGLGSMFGGWLLDRHGSRLTFGLAALLGVTAFSLATSTTSLAVFAIAAAIGGGAFGALGFYHVTQTAAVRVSPDAATRAIAVLTIWGAFASAIYIPLTAWLVEAVGWRTTLRITIATAIGWLVAGALTIDTRMVDRSRNPIWSELARSLRSPVARRYVAAQGLVGMGVAIILVYQVPAMTAAGLGLGAASFWAAFRGFAQLGGRLPLMPIVNRLQTTGALRLSYGAIVFGAVLLAFAGNPWVAAGFALVAGFGIGASSPLQGMHARLVFGASSLGTAMGLLSLAFMVIGSIGPALAGSVATATGSRAIPVLGGAVLTALAIPLIRAPDEVRSDALR